ncbi:MAG TPA: hypothetical protein DEB06_07450, partial [Phycisphaerales bacterium]|nr:hypothetical protein [Phycisphaerales bacterium]
GGGAGPGGPVLIVGAGKNGRVLGEALAHRSVRFRVFDDDPRAAESLAGAFACGATTDLSSAPAGAVLIVTPLDDAGLVERL